MYIQRQITAFVGNGTSSDPVTYGIGDRIWSSQDVYPAKIMIIDDGGWIADELVVASGGGTAILPFPQNHTNLLKLSFFLSCDKTVKVTVTKPDSTVSKVLVRAGTATDSRGAYSFTGLVIGNGIVVTNAGASNATIRYFCWDYPADITIGSAWRDGAQTVGTAPTT